MRVSAFIPFDQYVALPIRNAVDGLVMKMVSGTAWDNAAYCFRSTNFFVTLRDSDKQFRVGHRVKIKR